MSTGGRPTLDLSRSPWSVAPRDKASMAWRKMVDPAITHIRNAVRNSYPGGGDTAPMGSDAGINRMVEEIFRENELGDPHDRQDLIQWLGQAAGACSQSGSRTWRTAGTIALAESDMMARWTAAAWRSTPSTPAPDWADELVDGICQGVVDRPGVHNCWGPIFAGGTSGRGAIQANAQADIFTYLQAFNQQRASNPKTDEGGLIDDLAGRATACCFVALRVLASTSDRVDERVLAHLKAIDGRYDHRDISEDVLRRAGSAEDYKALSGGIKTGGGSGDIIAPGRPRKL